MPMRLSEPIHPTQGVTLQHGGYTKKQQQDSMAATRTFRPPHFIKYADPYNDSQGPLLKFIVPLHHKDVTEPYLKP